MHGVRHVSIRAVEVCGVDIEIWRSAHVRCKVCQDRGRAVPGPVAIPNVLTVGRSQNDRPAVIPHSLGAAARPGGFMEIQRFMDGFVAGMLAPLSIQALRGGAPEPQPNGYHQHTKSLKHQNNLSFRRDAGVRNFTSESSTIITSVVLLKIVLSMVISTGRASVSLAGPGRGDCDRAALTSNAVLSH